MTVGTAARIVEYAGDNSAAARPVPFKFLGNDEIRVVRVNADGSETVLTRGAHYSVAGAGNPSGGSVAPSTPIAAGTSWRIEGAMPLGQQTDYTAGDDFPAESHELALDRAMIGIQEARRDIGIAEARAIKVRRGMTAPDIDISGLVDGDLIEFRSGGFTRFVREPFAGKFYAGGPGGALVPASGTGGADGALRADMAAPTGAMLSGYGSDVFYPDGSVGNELIPRVLLSLLPAVAPKEGKLAFVQDVGRAGWWRCFPGTPPAGDLLKGLYCASDADGWYWSRVWDGINGDPQWWGGRYNDPAWLHTNTVAIAECMHWCPITRLSVGWLHVADPVHLYQNGRKIIGAGPSSQFFLDEDALTDAEVNEDEIKAFTSAIVLTGDHAATHDVLIVGRGQTWSQPAAPPIGWTAKPVAKGFDVRRTANVAPTTPNNAFAPAGVRLAWCSDFRIEDIFSFNSALGFVYQVSVYGHTNWCHSLRGAGSEGTNGNDCWVGFYVDGATGLGATYAGANASIYFNNCKTACFITPTGGGQATSIALHQGTADTFMEDMESYGSPRIGMLIYGANENSDPDVRQRSNGDIHLRRITIDGAGQNALRVEKTTAYSSINFDECYWVVGGSSSQTACLFTDCEGSIKMRGGEILGWVNSKNGGTGYGIYIFDSGGISITDVDIIGAIRPVVADYSRNLTIRVGINNPKEEVAGEPNPYAAVALVNYTHHCKVQPKVYAAETHGGERPGDFKAFACAVSCEATTNNNWIDTSEVDKEWLSGAYSVQYNGADVTAEGTFGTNNRLVGWV